MVVWLYGSQKLPISNLMRVKVICSQQNQLDNSPLSHSSTDKDNYICNQLPPIVVKTMQFSFIVENTSVATKLFDLTNAINIIVTLILGLRLSPFVTTLPKSDGGFVSIIQYTVIVENIYR